MVTATSVLDLSTHPAPEHLRIQLIGQMGLWSGSDPSLVGIPVAVRGVGHRVLSKVVVDPEYASLLGGSTSLLTFLLKTAALIEDYLASAGCETVRYVLGMYAAGDEEEPTELRPYIEVHVRVLDLRALIALWSGCLRYLAGLLGEQVFQHVSVFLTRAV